MKQNKSKKGVWIALVCIILLLAVIVVLENVLKPTSMLFPVLKKGAVYSLVAVSLNLLNGFTGLFSLGQAGFMLLGAYTYAILTVPSAAKESVYYLYGGSAVKFALQEVLAPPIPGGEVIGLILGVALAIILAGLVAAGFAYLIGLPVLRLKSDYLAIATLGFAEIIKAVFLWKPLGPVTNGSNLLKSFPTFSTLIPEHSPFYGFYSRHIAFFSTLFPLAVAAICITVIVLLINSSYGRAFKAIREDEIAAEAMGINLFRHKQLSFCISSFFAGIGGALLAMFQSTVAAAQFKSALTYEILLIVVIGGIGSVTGSCLASFLFVSCSEWWLRFLDSEIILENGFKVPFLRNGFRLVVFSVIIMIVVLFFRRGIMGDKELPDLFRRRAKRRKEAIK